MNYYHIELKEHKQATQINREMLKAIQSYEIQVKKLIRENQNLKQTQMICQSEIVSCFIFHVFQ